MRLLDSFTVGAATKRGQLTLESLNALLERAQPIQVDEFDPAVDEVLLELEAQDHVHPIRDLVGPDADQRRADTRDSGEEPVEVDVPELLGERLLYARVEEPPERPAASDEVLPQPAL